MFSSKEASFHYAENFLKKRKFELHQIYRALEVIAKENDLIQKRLYENSLSAIERNISFTMTVLTSTLKQRMKKNSMTAFMQYVQTSMTT